MKKTFLILMCFLLVFCSVGCTTNEEKTEGLKIVTTVFPAYDFARQIAGQDAVITMLLPPGSESHFYEPSLNEIAKIEQCDLFIYAGGDIDSWAEEILDSIGKHINTVCMSSLVQTLGLPDSDHAHEHKNQSQYTFDSHVWTSPKNAQIICKKINEALCSLDPKNSHNYTARLNDYNRKLAELDEVFKDISKSAKRRTLVFAERFPFLYFANEYGFDYKAALNGCSSETEPTLSAIADIINTIKSEDIPVVFYIEFSTQSIADMICSETAVQKRLLHSCHNVSADDFNSGETYLTLMQKNAQNIKEALY